MEKNEAIAIVIVVLVAFAGVFYYLSSKPAQEVWIENQLLVKSNDPVGEIQNRLGGDKILLQQNLYALNGSKNAAIAIMSSEITRAVAQQSKNASAYAIIEGGQNICGQENCSGAQVVVRVGECDCIFFNEKQVIVEGSEKFLIDQTVRGGRLFGFALSKTGK